MSLRIIQIPEERTVFVRVVNWATVLALALAATFAALLQWNEYAFSLYQPSPERELLRSLSLVPIVAIGFFVLAGVAWLVGWRFSRAAEQDAERSDLGIVFCFFGCYLAMVIGCLLLSPWSAEGLAAGGFLLGYYASAGFICWIMYRWQSRRPRTRASFIIGTEPWTYAWLLYGKLATPGLLALGYLNFEQGWQPWLALVACATYLLALRHVLLLVHRLLHWPILTEQDMQP